MSAATYNFTIEQGTDVAEPFVVKIAGMPVDLTGSSFRGQMRLSYDDDVHYDFSFAITDQINGAFQLIMTEEITAGIPAGKYRYDVEWINAAGKVKRLIKGTITVDPEVTKSE